MVPHKDGTSFLHAVTGIEQVDLILINMEQVFPFRPLWIAGGNGGIKPFIDVVDGDAVLRLGNELALLPKHLLESLDLVEEIDDLAAHRPDDPDNLEPAFGKILAGDLHVIQVQHFALDVKIQFPG